MGSIKDRPMTVEHLICVLENSIRSGAINKTDLIDIAVDAEGNAFSPLLLAGIEKTEDNKITIYPLQPQCA